MSKEKIFTSSPVPAKPEKSPLERMKELTQRIVRVPKADLPKKRKGKH